MGVEEGNGYFPPKTDDVLKWLCPTYSESWEQALLIRRAAQFLTTFVDNDNNTYSDGLLNTMIKEGIINAPSHIWGCLLLYSLKNNHAHSQSDSEADGSV